jgi:biotin carboxyl carrier protein
MRYYIINSEGKEVSFDLSVINSVKTNINGFKVSNGSDEDKQYYVKSLAGKSYISEDEKSWQKLPRLNTKNGLINVNETLNIYRGFKPSGLSNANAGDLITEMPGKIIKIMTTEGAFVSEGDTLIILEAMKMENEIKAGLSGVVKAVHITEGQILESGHLMIEVEE